MSVKKIDISPYKTGKRWELVVPDKGVLVAKMNVGNYTEFNILACRPKYVV